MPSSISSVTTIFKKHYLFSTTEKPTPLSNQEIKAIMTEALDNLSAIRTCQVAYKMEKGMYLECKPCPPNSGNDATPDLWTTPAPGFDETGFEPSGNVRYQYAVTVSADSKSFIATATGDVDENGIKVTYKLDTSSPSYPRVIAEPEDEI